MPKLKALYKCQECGYSAPKPMGQCPDCSAWNSMQEEVEAVGSAFPTRALANLSSEVVALKDVGVEALPRRATGLGELDRLLGGGVVPGQVILLGGPPGIGKSTLMAQAVGRWGSSQKVLYVSGEESAKQVSGRARRLGVRGDSLYLLCETNLLKIMKAIEDLQPSCVVLDSVQTVFHPELSGTPGSPTQVRECAAQVISLAKSRETVVFLLGHVTKEGALAGPKLLEHLVDTVLYFDTERHDVLRVLRAHKNRFGPTDEIGLFEMGEKGLKEVSNASSFFVEGRDAGLAGRAVSVALEGTRPILAEAQSLVVYTKYPLPRRMSTGLDLNRVLVLLAAMEKHLRLPLEDRDVFVSLAGGLRLKDPALDLAACLSVVSSQREKPLPADWVFLGEVGLLGEIGRVPFLESRLKEAAKAGFKTAVVPQNSLKDIPNIGIKLIGAADLRSAADRGLSA